MNQTILIERRSVNEAPEILQGLKKGDFNSEKFIENWKKLFDNIL